jgi:hypothetical protein
MRLTNQAHPQPGAAAVERNQKEQMKNKHPLVASAPAVGCSDLLENIAFILPTLCRKRCKAEMVK